MQPIFRTYTGRISAIKIIQTENKSFAVWMGTAFWGTNVKLLNAAGRGGGAVTALIGIRHDLGASVSGAGGVVGQLSTGFLAVVTGAGGVNANLGWGIGLIGSAQGSGGVTATISITQALSAIIGGNGAVTADLSVAAYAITLGMRGRLTAQPAEIIESPIRQQAADEIIYMIETISDMTTKTPVATTATRESTNADATSSVLLGTLTTNGTKLLLPRLGPLVAGEIYRINSRFMVGGNVVNVFFRVIAE